MTLLGNLERIELALNEERKLKDIMAGIHKIMIGTELFFLTSFFLSYHKKAALANEIQRRNLKLNISCVISL